MSKRITSEHFTSKRIGAALLTLAGGWLIASAAAVATAQPNQAGDEKTLASTDTKGSDLAAPADKNAAGAKLKIQDAFSVDQPVTVELLAALKAKRPPGKQPFKPASGSDDPVMDLPMAK